VDPATECPTSFCLLYEIAAGASWSDGEVVTSADFAHTYQLFDDAPDGSGYEHVTGIDIIDDKRFRVVFSEPIGSWQQLFRRVISERAAGPDASRAPTTGAFQIVDWTVGEELLMRRNPDWWAETDPLSGESIGAVDRLSFVFIDDLDDMVDALIDGDVDVISARPDADAIAELAGAELVRYRVSPGPFWEHIDFHHQDVLLRERWLREAISLGIDREEILDATVRLIDPTASGLDNTVWMSGTPWYEDHYVDRFHPEAAERLLVDNGCVRGDDDVFSCRGRRLSFTWASTSDDPARRDTYELVSEDLAAIGIELVEEFKSPSEFVGRDFLFGGPSAWQLINFSWRAPLDPMSAAATYLCDDSDLNVNRYCSETVESAIRSAETTVDPVERAALLNKADAAYLDDHAVIPLYQKPRLLAWRSGIFGLEPNYSHSSDLWNIVSWKGPTSIVVALPEEPDALDPLSFDDDNANMIMSVLLYGAFGMSSSLDVVPALVESVTVVEG
jgi:peptide/nickel transport system substrate-binding protein